MVTGARFGVQYRACCVCNNINKEKLLMHAPASLGCTCNLPPAAYHEISLEAGLLPVVPANQQRFRVHALAVRKISPPWCGYDAPHLPISSWKTAREIFTGPASQPSGAGYWFVSGAKTKRWRPPLMAGRCGTARSPLAAGTFHARQHFMTTTFR